MRDMAERGIDYAIISSPNMKPQGEPVGDIAACDLFGKQPPLFGKREFHLITIPIFPFRSANGIENERMLYFADTLENFFDLLFFPIKLSIIFHMHDRASAADAEIDTNRFASIRRRME